MTTKKNINEKQHLTKQICETKKLKKKIIELLNPFLVLENPVNLTQNVSLAQKINTSFISNTSYSYFFKNLNLLKFVLKTSLLFKYIFSSLLINSKINPALLILTLNNSLFPTKNTLFNKSNIVQFHTFNYKLKRRILKSFTFDTFVPNVGM